MYKRTDAINFFINRSVKLVFLYTFMHIRFRKMTSISHGCDKRTVT